MRTTTHRSLKIHTNSDTRWDDCDWDSMNPGRHMDVRAYRRHGRWIASSLHNWHDDDMGMH